MVPIGGITIWSGHKNDLPPNWHLCNGLGEFYDPIARHFRQIPDLRGRFVVGYSDSNHFSEDINYQSSGNSHKTINDAIGNNEKNKFITNSHYDSTKTIGQYGGAAEHKLLEDECAKHTHDIIGVMSEKSKKVAVNIRKKMNSTSNKAKIAIDFYTYEQGDSIADPVFYKSLGHSHDIKDSTELNQEEKDVEPHENRPPYYVLAFIIRVW
jgi:microcystin-dependent protein